MVSRQILPVAVPLLGLACLAVPAAAQFSFTDRTALLNGTVASGAPIAIADMNGDGKDDLVRLADTNFLTIDYQGARGDPFAQHVHGTVSPESCWALCIADVDHNGFNDIMAGPREGGIRLLTADATGSSYKVQILPERLIFVQGSLFADLDNDGSIDLFACDDNEDNHKYRNNGVGGFGFDNSLMDTSLPTGDGSGNYAAIWTDYNNDGGFDLYLSKCRATVGSPSDNRRINRLFKNDGNHSYRDGAPAAGLDDGAQSWCADFGDIDNDGDLDCFLLNHGGGESKLFENDGTGVFTPITTQAGLAGINYYGIQAVFRDFDNDTFLDLLVSASNLGAASATYRLYRNNGDKTFTNVPGILLENGTAPVGHLHSFAIGDLDHDGFLDIYGSRGELFNTPSADEPDLLFLNDGNANHFLAVQLTGRMTNPNAIGTRLELHGAWGVQVREVRAGEGYGIQNSLTKVFGLGASPAIDRLVVKWPSGVTEEIANPAADQFLQLREGDTFAPGDFAAPVITSATTVPGETGRPLPYRVKADHLATAFSIASEPDGMTIDPETGVLHWTPPSTGSFRVEVTATNPAGSDSETISLTISDPPAPVISGDLMAGAVAGQLFSYQLEADHGPVQWSLENEPLGMTVDAVSGEVRWVPAGSGSVMFEVTAVNAGGSDTRTLVVTISPAPDYEGSLDNDILRFTTSAAAPWFVQDSVVRMGSSAMQSGDVEDDESSGLETTLVGPGTLRFWWRVSSEPNFDHLRLRIDDITVRQINGETGWREVTFPIPSGPHTVAWSYEKDDSVSQGADAGYLDGISFTTPNDIDGDGLADTWEVANFGDLGAGRGEDPDRDRRSNLDESIAGTDPNDPSSFLTILAIVPQPDGTVQVEIASIPGKTYAVEGARALSGFAALSLPVTASAEATTVTVTVPGGEGLWPAEFYFRAVVSD